MGLIRIPCPYPHALAALSFSPSSIDFAMSSISQANSSTTTTFETALWLNAAVFGAELLVFTLVRKRFKTIYEPRTFLTPKNKRTNPLSSFILGWPISVWKADYHDIRLSNGMDSFFYVRFLRMMVKILLPIWLISWAVLLPLTSVNQSNGKEGLDRFTFGNINTSSQPRYAAHILLAWVFTIWIWYNIKTEMANFVTTRQQYFVDPAFACTPQANTILVTGVPPRYLSERAITQVFSHVPGGVRKVWLNRDLGELPELYDRRMKAVNKLESAETSLLKLANEAHAKQLKKGSKTKSESDVTPSDVENGSQSSQTPLTSETLVPENKRPTHKIPKGKIPLSLLFLGKKVDTIQWAREEIANTTAELEKGRKVLHDEEAFSRDHAAGISKGKIAGMMGLVQRAPLVNRKHAGDHKGSSETSPTAAEKHSTSSPTSRTDGGEQATSNGGEPDSNFVDRSNTTYPPLNSAFILFHNQAAAHMAAQVLAHHEPYRMTDREIGVAPEDIIWGNLGLNPYERRLRLVASYAATLGLIICWAFPVAFVGAVSNVAKLCETYSWLAWLCKLPKTVLGIIQGILPPVLLAVLMMLLPIVLRLLAKFEGIPRRTGVELSLMTRFFIFQIIHGFLIVTLASGIIAALPELVGDPTSIPSILAQNLPSASTFFLTYVVLQGLSGAAAGFLQAVPLAIYYAKMYLLGSTPRSVYTIRYTLRGVSWGTLFPVTTLLAVITITYSVISPIINGLACFTFFLFFQLYKYLFLYQFDQPAALDTGGLFFPKAIQHLFVGLYIQQICLAALFFLARNAEEKASAIPEGALMIVLIIFTALFHIMINNSYGPLLHYLPLSLADKAHVEEEQITGGAGRADTTRIDSDGTDAVSPTSPTLGRGGVGGKRSIDPLGGTEKSDRAGSIRSDVDSPAAADRRRGLGAGTGSQESQEVDDFYHPAAVEPQRIVWIPADRLELHREEERACVEAGVDASSANARMDEKGRVHVDGPPPGEDVEY